LCLTGAAASPQQRAHPDVACVIQSGARHSRGDRDNQTDTLIHGSPLLVGHRGGARRSVVQNDARTKNRQVKQLKGLYRPCQRATSCAVYDQLKGHYPIKHERKAASINPHKIDKSP